MQGQPTQLDLYRRARALAAKAQREPGMPPGVLAVAIGESLVMCQVAVPRARLVRACAELLAQLDAGAKAAAVRA